MVVQFEKVLEPLGGGASLEELWDWGKAVRFLEPGLTSCLLSASRLLMYDGMASMPPCQTFTSIMDSIPSANISTFSLKLSLGFYHKNEKAATVVK